ncbi:MAG: hypothetical protein KF791_02945 [Verrucomicrobiae bacterium]|nr:hypothetical protein [Verrucomicrobiae bacterium]
MDSLEALDAGGRMLIRWTTSLEHGLLGFALQRQDGGDWRPVGGGMIVAENALEGGWYEVLDEVDVPGPHRYRIAAISESGDSTLIREQALAAAGVVESEGFPPVSGGRRVDPTGVPGPALSGRLRQAAPSLPVDLTTGPAVLKIQTSSRGIHFVSAAAVAGMVGQPLTTVQAWISSGRVALFLGTNQVHYIPGNGWVAAGQTGPGFFFHAEELRNNYTTTNVYWLRRGTNTFVTESGGNPTPRMPGQYQAVISAQVDAVEARATVLSAEEDFWFWTRLTANSASDSWNPRPQFTIDSQATRSASVSARLNLRLYGSSRTPHLAEVTLIQPGGQQQVLGTLRFSGIGPAELSLNFPSDRLGVGVNQLGIRALLDTGVRVSQFLVDGYELVHPRSYYTVGSTRSLEAGAEGAVIPPGGGAAVITVPGFGSAESPTLVVLDVTDVRRPRLINNVRVDFSGTWRASFTTPSLNRRFAVFQPVTRAAQSYPAAMSVVFPTSWASPTNRASYVVITHDSLSSVAEQLAAYRSPQFRTRVIPIEDIYNEFGDGITTPHALARFFREAHERWAVKPRYAVLLGDGTYDYRNLQAANDNLVPPLLLATPYGLNTSDSRYGDVLGTGAPRILIGRFPVRTVAEAGAMLAKIQSYESVVTRNPLKSLLVADQPDLAGDFISNINQVESYLAPTFTSTKVHPARAPAVIDRADMTNRIRLALNGGVDVMNYVGHGAVDRFGTVPYVWVTQPPVTSSVMLHPPMANGARLPVVFAMTCVAGMYSAPGFTCLGEAFVRTPNMGAVAMVAPTGLSQDTDAMELNRVIMELLSCNTRGRLGDMVAQSMSLYSNRKPAPFTPVWIYNLLGDPALRLVSPVVPVP